MPRWADGFVSANFLTMAKTKVKVKVSGTPAQVKKALHTLTNSESPEPILREADFRSQQKRQAHD